MEHPGVDAVTIKQELSLEQIQSKISELTSRLSFAYRIQNQPLIHQIGMVLEVYKRVQAEKLDEMFSTSGQDIAGNINIS